MAFCGYCLKFSEKTLTHHRHDIQKWNENNPNIYLSISENNGKARAFSTFFHILLSSPLYLMVLQRTTLVEMVYQARDTRPGLEENKVGWDNSG